MKSATGIVMLVLLALIFANQAYCLTCPDVALDQSGSEAEEPNGRGMCWNGDDSNTGCCSTGSCVGSHFKCEGRCKGWSVDISLEPQLSLSDQGGFTQWDKDDACVWAMPSDSEQPGISLQAHSNSCVILWEKRYCTGRSWTMRGGRISDIRTHGWANGFYSLSGCYYDVPERVEVKLWQHNFWALLGKRESLVIGSEECKYVGKWWDGRISMIQKIGPREGCFMFWEHKGCTGRSLCECGWRHLELKEMKVEGIGNISWNNKISSLSFCRD